MMSAKAAPNALAMMTGQSFLPIPHSSHSPVLRSSRWTKDASSPSVVPRDQLRQRLLDEKKGSYRPCLDESCQIELGKGR